MKGDRFGSHRVMEPKGALPQAAVRLNNDTSVLYANEILIDVDVLNIDAASFRQIEESSLGRDEGIAERVQQTVRGRGKQHNPVTGSGGMLLGQIAAIGTDVKTNARVGDRIATLVSLTLTPLRIDEVRAVRRAAAQLEVRGQAILFETGPFAVIPRDMPERVVLAALDVAGAAPQVARICSEGDTVLVLGAGGKSGILCAYEAKRRVGSRGRVIGVESYEPAAAELRALGLCDEVIAADGRHALQVRERVLAVNHGREVDRAISCVNVDGAEMGAILSTRDRGIIYFFSMTTSFTRAALGAEGVGRDVDMLIGNGFAENHAEFTLQILRDEPSIRGLVERRYG